MHLTRSCSEKRTYRTVNDQFISREFMVSRSIEVPPELNPVQVQHLKYQLLTQVREEVMICFMLAGMMTHDEFVKDLFPFRQIEEAARQAAYPGTAPVAVPSSAPLNTVEEKVADSLVGAA